MRHRWIVADAGALSTGVIVGLGSARGGGAIDLPRLAVGSLVDGCLAEGIAADVAALARAA